MSDSVSKYFENANSSNGNIKPIQKDPIVENVKRLYDVRSKIGIDKYNTTLFDSPDGFYKFLNHLQEELMDATLYVEKLKNMKK
tara:strand:+ start:717 stop:968 length:252 start_codon:yes stop_codon:yes gene_type:complete